MVRIVWATDGSAAAAACVPVLRALDAPEHTVFATIVGPPALLSEARPDPSRLLWHVVPGYRDEVSARLADLAEAETARLGAFRAQVESAARLGSPAVELIDVALAERADLVVLGAHGHGAARRLLLGSVSQQVAQHAPCSVLVVRRKRRPARVVLGLDGAPESARALDLLLEMHPRPGDVAVVAHAVADPPPLRHVERDAREDRRIQELYARAVAGEQQVARTRVQQAARRLRKHGWTVETSIRRGTPVGVLLDLARARTADLLAIGAHGEHAGDESLGADSLHLLQQAPCSVLIAREEHSTTPRARRGVN